MFKNYENFELYHDEPKDQVHNFSKGWTISSAPSITANWNAPKGNEWTVLFGIGIGRTTVFNGRPMTPAVQYYHNVERPSGTSANLIRFQVTLLYPKK